MRIRKRTGFTLVEFLIVVAIIGLLAAIAMPSFLKARVDARAQAVGLSIRTTYMMKDSKRLVTITRFSKWVNDQDYLMRVTHKDDNSNRLNVMRSEIVDLHDHAAKAAAVPAPKWEKQAKVTEEPQEAIKIIEPDPISTTGNTVEQVDTLTALRANKTFESDFDDFFNEQLNSKELRYEYR